MRDAPRELALATSAPGSALSASESTTSDGT